MLTGESIGSEVGPGDEAFAGALIRRGEATADVIATGAKTSFGRGVELIRTADVESTQQKAVLRVVQNLAFFTGAVTVLLAAYAFVLHLPVARIASLGLVAPSRIDPGWGEQHAATAGTGRRRRSGPLGSPTHDGRRRARRAAAVPHASSR